MDYVVKAHHMKLTPYWISLVKTAHNQRAFTDVSCQHLYNTIGDGVAVHLALVYFDRRAEDVSVKSWY
ncbi:uncharacterized protein PHALS_15222 [Plasmopara halstedii]|uniref:Uncharacterized protein n=1 Tax=Plasmopara halstedii TaxID=4781 RepID=A0A0P1B5U1_PLAHL|nr:uncharacterized protein PHALS_15222 [Plasmopara halstedii]CEG49616.1 hypothetical protein PHALS_15222 [Plasmopara halstedii]|eukprot:XP_024585985.1 hypothetical protein PHALS_15222 [Plasmopara halstedii]